jgi:hypothetical protein
MCQMQFFQIFKLEFDSVAQEQVVVGVMTCSSSKIFKILSSTAILRAALKKYVKYIVLKIYFLL